MVVNSRCLFFIVLFISLFSVSSHGINGSDVLAALDNPSGVEFLGFQYWKHKIDEDGWPVEDEDGNYVYVTKPSAKLATSSGKWTIQNGLKDNTLPQTGTCIRSNITVKGSSASMQTTQIHLRVHGPGILKLKYKTSSGMGDSFNVYVDGMMEHSASGYDTDYTPGTEDWSEVEIVIQPGKATEGSQAGTYYHEIILEYAQDGTSYADDGPRKPIKSEYDGDLDAYEYDKAMYENELSYYADAIWIDAGFITPEPEYDENDDLIPQDDVTVWMPADQELSVRTLLSDEFEDSATVYFATNVNEWGYVVRYTLDGTEPTGSSSLYDFDKGVVLTETTTLTAKAFDGTRALSPAVRDSCTYYRRATMPALTKDEAGSSPDVMKYVMHGKGHSDDRLYYRFQGGSWRLCQDGDVIAVTSAGMLEGKAVPASETARESGIVQVTIESATMPEVSATSNLRPCASGTVLGESASATIKGDPAEGTVLQWRKGESEAWQAWEKSQVARSSDGKKQVYHFRGVADGKLASEIVEFVLYFAVDTLSVGNGDGQLELARGWNLVCVPMVMDEASREALFASMTLYGMDRTTQAYTQCNSLETTAGYFCYVRDAEAVRNLRLKGVVVEEAAVVGRGWNLVGGAQVDVDKDVCWTWRNGKFERVRTVEAARGYFIYRAD